MAILDETKVVDPYDKKDAWDGFGRKNDWNAIYTTRNLCH